MVVGFLKDNYPEQRCIINKVGGAVFPTNFAMSVWQNPEL